MTDRQRATIAFLAYILKTQSYSKNFNAWVYRSDEQNKYRYRLEKQFTPEYLSLVENESKLEVTEEKMHFDATGATIAFHYKVTERHRIELNLQFQKTLFEGVTPEGGKFYGEYLTNKAANIAISDPESDNKKFEYVIEFVR